MATLRCVSLNCHGLSAGVVQYLKSIVDNYDVILLQETWLSNDNCCKLQDISENFVFFHSSAMEDKLIAGLYTGRPYGGTAILIRKHFAAQVSRVVTYNARITAILCHRLDQPDLVICSVYMPWNDRSVHQLDEYVLSVGCLQGLIDSHLGCMFVFGGDMNVVKYSNSAASSRLDDFCQSNNLCWVDPDVCEVNYSYHCEASNHYSMIDYFICSQSLLQSTFSKSGILVDDINTSDHYAVNLSLLGVTSSVDSLYTNQPHYKLRWDRADLSLYQSTCNKYLSGIDLPVEALLCKTANCCNHFHILNGYYCQLVDCLRGAGDICVPQVRAGTEKHWWSPELEDLKQQCIQIVHIWRNCGCPRSGSINEERIRTKLRYKCAIKESILAAEYEFNEGLMSDLCRKDFNGFWKSWRKRFCSRNLRPTDCLNSKIGPENVLDEFTSHFKNVSKPNTVGADETYKSKVLDHLSTASNSIDSLPFIDVSLISDKLCMLKTHKAGGLDGIQNEHIMYAGPSLAVHLCLLFNALLRHAFVPDDFRFGIIKPLLKNKHGDQSKPDMYRGITLAPVISKLFESVLLSLYGSSLHSDHLQFGFKANSGCNDAMFTFIESATYFNKRDSKLYCALLDASKAFDKVLINGLIYKLIKRNVPLQLIRLLFFWLNNVHCSVVWLCLMSAPFHISCGVRQGGVLSPVLFSVYVDELIVKLRSSGYGIYIGTLFYGCIFYADDIALLSCSCYGLQKLLDICIQYGFQWDIKFNPDKSYAGTLGGDHPTSVNVELSNKPLQWAVQLKYLGCVFRCRSCDIKLDSFVGKFYGAFNNIMRVLGSNRNELVAVHLMSSYCLPSLLYGCEIWHTRDVDVRSASVAWNNGFRKIFNACWRETVRPLQFFCSCLPLSILIHQRRLLYWKKCMLSNNVIVQTLAKCCYVSIVALCDVYKFTVKDLIDLPVYRVKDLIWLAFSSAL